ncbi:MAG: PAS domain-containing sensor histidine kinase [Anaeromyxobacteraceae bacterium]
MGSPHTRDLFRLLVEAVREYAIFLLDTEGRITSWNRGAERINGYRAEEVLGRHFSLFYDPADVRAGRPEQNLRKAAEEGSAEEEGWRVRKDGTLFRASVVLTAVRDDDGTLVGFAKITRDLTGPLREAEASRALEVARRAMAARDEFLAAASHELRTPVAALLLTSQALRRWAASSKLPPVQRRQVGELELQAGRLDTLVDRLLEASTRASGRHPALSLRRGDLAQVARRLVARLRPQAARAGVRLRLVCHARPEGEWDLDRLEEALAALVDNAIKYGERRPVRVEVAAGGDWASVSVTDSGLGVSQEDQRRIFERFERAVPTRNISGFGVGLWAAREIALAHGGDIDVASAPGVGSTFRLRLPRETSAGVLTPARGW